MKKTIPTLVVSVMAVSSALNAFGSVVYAEALSPKFYVDITYETENTIRADFIFENVPEFANGGFLIRYDDGWTPVINRIGEPDYTRENCATSLANSLMVKQSEVIENLIGIVFLFPCDLDNNGRFLSLYFNKTDSYTSTNSNINVEFGDLSALNAFNGNCVVGNGDQFIAPEITQTNEYMIGDLDGDNRVDATDASAVLYRLRLAGVDSLSPKAIENNYRNYFPSALAPAAPDADKSGLINKYDADEILEYYGNVMTTNNYEGQIGSMDIYEYYNS